MFQALLKGKLAPEEERLEDVLTSNVFGTLQYFAIEDGLKLILVNAIDEDGYFPFANKWNNISNPNYLFWEPMNNHGCKPCVPDVLITMQQSQGQNMIVLVESKYRSGKSSFPDRGKLPNDQLAREWHNLTKVADLEKSSPILLYITDHFGFPKQEILESKKEFEKKVKLSKSPNIIWISWRKIPNIFVKSHHQILRDMVKVLQRQGLIFYEGIPYSQMLDIRWSYNKRLCRNPLLKDLV